MGGTALRHPLELHADAGLLQLLLQDRLRHSRSVDDSETGAVQKQGDAIGGEVASIDGLGGGEDPIDSMENGGSEWYWRGESVSSSMEWGV